MNKDLSKRKVLFVDDEKRVLKGLERMLFSISDEWDLFFAESGKDAIGHLEKDHIDVLVTDMRMPGMDGTSLLIWTMNNRPDVVRIVLSGYAEEEEALRSICIAHQFLSKPCKAKQLKEVVERACALQEILSDVELKKAIGCIDALPPHPKTFNQLNRALAKERSSLKEIGLIINQDIALSSKVLQLVNSAFFGLPHKVSSVERAVALLGSKMLRNIVLAVEAFSSFKASDDLIDFDVEQSHAISVANLAKKLAPFCAEDAFMAGLLHDMGRLVFATTMPQFLRQVKEAKKNGDPRQECDIERDLGVCHAIAGAYLLGLWGLPYPIVEAVAFHHFPEKVMSSRFDLLSAVSVANEVIGKRYDRAEELLDLYDKADELEELIKASEMES